MEIKHIFCMFTCTIGTLLYSQEVNALLGGWLSIEMIPLLVKYEISLDTFNKAEILKISKIDEHKISQELEHPNPLRQKKCFATYASNGKERILNLKRILPENSKRESEIFYYSDKKKDLYVYKNLKYVSILPSSYILDEPIWTQYLCQIPMFPELNTWVNFKYILLNGALTITKNKEETIYAFKIKKRIFGNQKVFLNYKIIAKNNTIKKLQVNQTVEENGEIIHNLPIECEIAYFDYIELGASNIKIPKRITISRYFIKEKNRNDRIEFESIPSSKEQVNIVDYSTNPQMINKEFVVNIPKGTRISDSLQNRSFIVGDYLENLEKNMNSKK